MDEGWLNLVRLARDIGDISSLFPKGITRVYDLPFTVAAAIRQALHFLSFEELPEKERPPKRIWLDPEKMKAWWAKVKQDREDEMKGNGAISDMPQNTDVLKQFFGGRAPTGV